MHSFITVRRKAAPKNYPHLPAQVRGRLKVVVSACLIFPSANRYASLSVTKYCELTFISHKTEFQSPSVKWAWTHAHCKRSASWLMVSDRLRFTTCWKMPLIANPLRTASLSISTPVEPLYVRARTRREAISLWSAASFMNRLGMRPTGEADCILTFEPSNQSSRIYWHYSSRCIG